jgi:MFS family permease
MVTRSSRNVALYFACQALMVSTMSLLVTVSPLVGAMLAPDARLATLPAMLQQLATSLATYPASQVMARIGRRAGFSLGAALGVMGGVAATLGILRGSFVLFCAGTGLLGGYAGFATFYRFAAAESVPPERRERALGWVMTAGVLAAFLGPWLAGQTKDLWPTTFAGSFALLFVMAFLALVVLQFLGASAAQAVSGGSRVSAAEIVRKPVFLIFTGAAMVSGATMVFVMTATSLAMAGCHHSFDHTTHVIQWHVVAMFAPSPITGRLIARFGVPQIVLAGLFLCVAAAIVNASGTSVLYFQIGLFLLGLGWNLAYLGVSTMLTRVAPGERATTQGLNDLLVSLAVAMATLLSGVVEHTAGWRVLNLAALPLLALAGLGVALRLRSHRVQEISAA